MTSLVKHFINGEYVESQSGKTFENISPVTGQVIGRVCEAGAAEVDAACESAKRALNGEWGRLSMAERDAVESAGLTPARRRGSRASR